MSKCANLKYGIDSQGKVVWVDELDIDKHVGLNCNLKCVQCSEPLVAVRKNADDPTKTRFHYLRHESGSQCLGTSESGLHKAAKTIASDLVGKSFYLPALSLVDAVPHESRYKDSGARRKVSVPLPGSKLCKLSDKVVRQTARRIVVQEVRIESECNAIAPTGLRPDAMLRVGSEWVALELRVTHKKTLDDVGRYALAGLGVVEIYLNDLMDADREELMARITGTRPPESQENPYFGREWLFAPQMLSRLMNDYHVERLSSADNTKPEGSLLFRTAQERLLLEPGKPSTITKSIQYAEQLAMKMNNQQNRQELFLKEEPIAEQPIRLPSDNSYALPYAGEPVQKTSHKGILSRIKDLFKRHN